MAQYCYFNGEILPFEEVKLGVNDLGLLRSYACFDYLRTYNGKPFRWEDHYQRFKSSANGLMLPFDYSQEKIRKIIIDLLQKSEMQDAAVRLILTGGYSTDSMSVSTPNFIVAIEPLPFINDAYYTHGVKLIMREYQRDVPQAKSTSYLNAVMLQPEKERENAFDVLYYNGKEVLEVTRQNFFIFKNNTLITPKDNILHGITRKVVLELAKNEFEVEERLVDISELATADEAFLCGTTKKVIPVVRLDNQQVANGKVGEHTKKLMQLFDDYISAY